MDEELNDGTDRYTDLYIELSEFRPQLTTMRDKDAYVAVLITSSQFTYWTTFCLNGVGLGIRNSCDPS